MMPPRFAVAGAFSFALICSAASGVATPPSYPADVRPILERYCFDCHSGDRAEAGITLDAYKESRAKTHERKAWVNHRLPIERKAEA